MAEDKTSQDEGLVISADLQKEIDEKVAELRKADPKLRKVYPIAVSFEDEEGEESVIIVGYFKQPDLKIFSKHIVAAQKDQVIAMKTLANDCFIGGDRRVIDDDATFLFGTMGQLGELTRMRESRLVNLSKARE